MNKKRGLILITCLLFLFLLHLTLAQTGCFLYTGSIFYCFDLEEKSALEECVSYDDCTFSQVFSRNNSCENLTLFPDCEEIYCKSTCDYQFLGNCIGGEILVGTEKEWCSPGCCQIINQSCGYTRSKWACELEAQGKNYYFYDSKLTESSCNLSCKQNLMLNLSTLSNVTINTKKSSNQSNITSNITSNLTVNNHNKSSNKSTVISSTNSSTTSGNNLWVWLVFILLFAFSVTFFIFYQKQKNKEVFSPLPPPLNNFTSKQPRNVPITTTTFSPINLPVKEQKEHHRQPLVSFFGLDEQNKPENYFHQLTRIVKLHELKKKDWNKRILQEHQDFFNELDSLAKKIKSKTGLAENEAKDVFERLKNLIESNK